MHMAPAVPHRGMVEGVVCLDMTSRHPQCLGSDEKILSQGFCASLLATQPAGRVVVVVHVGGCVCFFGLCFVGHVTQVPNIEWAVESPVLLSISPHCV
jgi:hypothetical protein